MRHSNVRAGVRSNAIARAWVIAALVGLPASTLPGQGVDVSNTDTGRPFRVEDALAVPRYALDLHLLPAWSAAGASDGWSLRPGAYYGLVPRTQIEVELPMVLRRAGGDANAEFAGVRLAAQHNVNVERRAWPALALDASVLLAAGQVRRAHPAVKGIATKTFKWARLNVSSEALFGSEPVDSRSRSSLPRWETGVAFDRLFPRRASLAGLEVVARKPMEPSAAVQWSAGVGARYQLTPLLLLDARVARAFTGAPQAWDIALGVSRFVPMSALLPGLGRWGRS